VVSPLELPGTQFLILYGRLLMGMLLVAYGLRQWLLRPGDEGAPPARDLDPYAIAMLGGHARRAADTALASLFERRILSLNLPERRITCQQPPESPSRLHTFERAVLDRIPSQGVPLEPLHAELQTVAAALYEDQLRAHGLFCHQSQERWARYLPALLLVGLGLLGLVKFLIGMAERRPVSVLGILLLMTAGCAAVFLLVPSWRTRRGRRVHEALREEHLALQLSASSGSPTLPGRDLVLALGLFGLEGVSLPSLQEFRAQLPHHRPNTSGGAASCGGACGGGSGCGGGCGGCGGCGG
jgi:uncharacterized protein (TIGR04222 family)